MKKFIFENKASILLGVLILAIASFLRLSSLTYLPIFGDEAIYVRWAQVMRAEPTLRFLPLSDGKQPLFMWVVIPFLKIVSDPLYAGRVVSVLSGIATAGGVIGLSYLLFKSFKVSLIAALIYSLSPFSVFFDRMALADSMLSAFGVWSLFFILLTAKSLRLDFAMIAGFFLGGGLLTKSPALFYALLAPAAWLFSAFPKKRKDLAVHLIKLMVLTAVTIGIGYGVYNILRLGPNFHMVGIRNQDYVFAIPHIWENPKDPFIFHVKEIFQWLWMLGPSVFILLLLSGLALAFKKYPRQLLILVAWAGVPLFAGAMYAKVFTARYILFSLPPLIIIAALGFLETKDKIKKVLIGILVVFVIHSLYINWQLHKDIQKAPLPRSERSGYLEEWTSGYGIRQVAVQLREKYISQGSQIVAGTEGYFGTLPDGLQIYLNDLPDVKVFGVGIIIKDLPQELIDSKKTGNPTYFIINSTRYKGDADEAGLRLVGQYPKALRPDTTREALLFFEVTEAATVPKEISEQE